jgi:hypothetical protein
VAIASCVPDISSYQKANESPLRAAGAWEKKGGNWNDESPQRRPSIPVVTVDSREPVLTEVLRAGHKK